MKKKMKFAMNLTNILRSSSLNEISDNIPYESYENNIIYEKNTEFKFRKITISEIKNA